VPTVNITENEIDFMVFAIMTPPLLA
jgi:hypothetical protein